MKTVLKPFIKWVKSEKKTAKDYKENLRKTCLQDRMKLETAARFAFKAGTEEGIRIMKNKLAKLIKEN